MGVGMEKRDSDALSKQMSWLPQISRLLSHTWVEETFSMVPRPFLVRVMREVVEQLRHCLREGKIVLSSREEALEWVLQRLEGEYRKQRMGRLRRVINATGVVIHTNLGRSPYCQRALERIQEISQGYCNLEMELETRRRGGRMSGIENAFRALVGAPAAYVVNNNAAAVVLALSTLAQGKEVVISRGELVEIGGSFRVPDVMEASGAILREVGTTNRTHLRDYRKAIGKETGLLLKVHRSNFAQVGFTSEVELKELVALGKEEGIPVMIDLGSGSLFAMDELPSEIASVLRGKWQEPTLQQILQTGVDLVTCSGDKLLGGPQAGILLGGKELIKTVASQPLARALRVDKLTLAGLEATLQVYLEEGKDAMTQIPIWAMLSRSQEELLAEGKQLLERLSGLSSLQCALEEGVAAVGGGALPGVELPTVRLTLQHSTRSIESLDQQLRMRELPILSLLDRGRLVFDLRTVRHDEQELLIEAICELHGR